MALQDGQGAVLRDSFLDGSSSPHGDGGGGGGGSGGVEGAAATGTDKHRAESEAEEKARLIELVLDNQPPLVIPLLVRPTSPAASSTDTGAFACM